MRPLPPRASGPLGIGLWCLFAVLVLAGGALVLRACGTQPNFVWARNFCPAPPDNGRMLREAEIGGGLQRQVHTAEMHLTEMPPCPPPRPVPSAPQPQQRTESDNMDRRVEQRGGKRGKLQFTLSWRTTDDLDINVDCPGGQISGYAGHRGPGICGDGVKDIDANRNLVENVSSTPIENVSWSSDVPDGSYVISIIEYRARRQGGNTVPFSLRMRWDGEEKICHDVVTEWPQSQFLHEDGNLYMGTYRRITWQSFEQLPKCEFETQRSFRVEPK